MERILGLCIGVNQYEDQRIWTLRYAESDAQAMCAVLGAMNRQDGPGRSPSVLALTGAQATKREIERAVSSWLGKEVTERDVVVLYFAGHGGTEASGPQANSVRPYLLPQDAQADDLFSSAIDMERIGEWFTKRLGRARAIVALLDCCFSGGAGGRTFALSSQRSLQVHYAPERAVLPISGEGRVIMTATKADEMALEDDEIEGGIFTCHILDFLLHSGRQRHPSGNASILALWEYVHHKVAEHARSRRSRMTPGIKNDLQTPVQLGLLSETEARKLKFDRPRFPWHEQADAMDAGPLDALDLLSRDVAAFNRAVARGAVSKVALRASNLRGMDLRSAQLAGMDLEIAELRDADLSGCFAQGASFNGAYLQQTLLRGADLREASFDGAYLHGTDLSGSDLRGTSFRGAIMRQVILQNVKMHGDILREADLDDQTRTSHQVKN